MSKDKKALSGSIELYALASVLIHTVPWCLQRSNCSEKMYRGFAIQSSRVQIVDYIGTYKLKMFEEIIQYHPLFSTKINITYCCMQINVIFY
jgi:hypothetical protein